MEPAQLLVEKGQLEGGDLGLAGWSLRDLVVVRKGGLP